MSGDTKDRSEGSEPREKDRQSAADAAEAAFFADSSAQSFPAPLTEDGADPELLKLPRRKRRHPLVSLLVIGLSAYLMYFTREDMFYFLQSRVPADIGHVRDVVAKADGLTPNRYVKLEGAPDRKNALLLEGKFSGYDSLYRVHESQNLVFVQAHRKERATDREVSAIHQGRLLPFRNRPYFETVRSYLAKSMTNAHELDDKALRQLLLGKAVKDQKGLGVSVEPKSIIWINASFPNEWILQFSKQRYATIDHARKQIGAIALPIAVDVEPADAFWRFVILATAEQVEPLVKQLAPPALHAGVIRRQISLPMRPGAMKFEGDTLVIQASASDAPTRYLLKSAAGASGPVLEPVRAIPVRLEASDIRYITTGSRFELPDRAMIVLSGDQPRDYWYYLLLYLVLGTFIVLNAVALINRARRV
jgi:hypothetical protein